MFTYGFAPAGEDVMALLARDTSIPGPLPDGFWLIDTFRGGEASGGS
jgi:hypothetical protein